VKRLKDRLIVPADADCGGQKIPEEHSTIGIEADAIVYIRGED